MLVSTPSDTNPLFQEYMFHKWMDDVDGYSETRMQALDSLRRIIEFQYQGQGCVIGRLIYEYDMMVYDFAWDEDCGESRAKAMASGQNTQWSIAMETPNE